MSLRTLVCVLLGFAPTIAAAIAYFGLVIEVGNATLPIVVAALPFWLAGFWHPFGRHRLTKIPRAGADCRNFFLRTIKRGE